MVKKVKATPKTRKKKEEVELPFKINDHHLVPKHELVPGEEASDLLKRYNATPDQFPFILATDAAAKEIGAKPGDFVKIVRRSETAGDGIYFRYVVDA
ncbi:MAG: DNA-directed RNA polymerase subunit H [Thaumarchaeota archaeon]|nr:DNA-directed RNA polymerase subunit H [Nitrososphaerota archaeon]MBI3115934.1 DNA-directed RNA polymerase subunit H [Nitrososphaerota archaeon]MCS4540172.1 DNA-directed RNA polymerase subunit H [Nitrososphaerota archaeon]